MSEVTVEQAREVCEAVASACELCDGVGRVQRTSRPRRPSGRRRHQARVRYPPCPACKYTRMLAEGLGQFDDAWENDWVAPHERFV